MLLWISVLRLRTESMNFKSFSTLIVQNQRLFIWTPDKFCRLTFCLKATTTRGRHCEPAMPPVLCTDVWLPLISPPQTFLSVFAPSERQSDGVFGVRARRRAKSMFAWSFCRASARYTSANDVQSHTHDGQVRRAREFSPGTPPRTLVKWGWWEIWEGEKIRIHSQKKQIWTSRPSLLLHWFTFTFNGQD